MVDVVQLVEHRIVVPSVVGSSPIIHPSKSPLREGFFRGVNTGGSAPSYTPRPFLPDAEMALIKLSELFNHASPMVTRRHLGLRREELGEVYEMLRF